MLLHLTAVHASLYTPAKIVSQKLQIGYCDVNSIFWVRLASQFQRPNTRHMCIFQQGLSLVGAAVVACAAFSLLAFIFAKFIRAGKNLKKSYGTWAIVTGATGNVGLAQRTEEGRVGKGGVGQGRTR